MARVTSPDICRICSSAKIQVLLDFGPRPITKRLLDSVPPEREYLHHLTLSICEECGFVQIFDGVPQAELYTDYNLHSAWKPQPHLVDEVQTLFGAGMLQSESFVLEVGCNDGSALKTLREFGIGACLGVEPSRDVAAMANSAGFQVINAYFDAPLAEEIVRSRGEVDLAVCRQVLEHVPSLDSFMSGMRSVVKEGGHLLIEVPDFAVPLAYGDVSAIWEEHLNYFTENSLTFLLERYGFTAAITKRYDFSGGALCIIARRESRDRHPAGLVNEFEANSKYGDRVRGFAQGLSDLLKEKRTDHAVAVYGAGNRSAIVINYCLQGLVDFVVDDQPEKQNQFMPLSHLPIYPSCELIERRVKLCLLAVNSENDAAVIAKHSDFIRQGGAFLPMLSPAPTLVKWTDS